MESAYVPDSLRSAALQLRLGLAAPLHELPKLHFVRVWCSLAYLFPGLHPDGFDSPGSGWPRVLKRFAVEAWRRAELGLLNDAELYPCDAQWCGLYDRMNFHSPEEIARRLSIGGSSPQNA